MNNPTIGEVYMINDIGWKEVVFLGSKNDKYEVQNKAMSGTPFTIQKDALMENLITKQP